MFSDFIYLRRNIDLGPSLPIISVLIARSEFHQHLGYMEIQDNEIQDSTVSSCTYCAIRIGPQVTMNVGGSPSDSSPIQIGTFNCYG